MRSYAIIVLLLGTLTFTTSDAAGSLDPTFGNDGRFVIEAGVSLTAAAMIRQDDGKLLVAGTWDSGATQDMFVARVNANGSLDTSFGGGDGLVQIDFVGSLDRANALALLDDGRILVAGAAQMSITESRYDAAVARLAANGSLDTTFGSAGKATIDFGGTFDDAQGLSLQSDGKVVVAGWTNRVGGPSEMRFALARLAANGTLDASYGQAGGLTLLGIAGMQSAASFGAMAVQADGALVLASSTDQGEYIDRDFSVVAARVLANGMPDPAFGTGGIVVHDYSARADIERASDVAILPNGKILIAGSFAAFNTPGHAMLLRLNPNGSRDSSFGAAGWRVHRLAFGSSLERIFAASDGYVYALGRLNDWVDSDPTTRANAQLPFAVRFDTAGSLDATFGAAGVARFDIGGASITHPDAAFDFMNPSDILLQPDGRLISLITGYGSANMILVAASVTGPGDVPGILGLVGAAYGQEGDGVVTVVVERTGGTSGAVSVGYRTADGSANSASDYVTATGQLTWADGDGSPRLVAVPVVNDRAQEAMNEDFVLELHDATGGASIGLARTHVQLGDDDDGTPGQVVAGGVQGREGSAPAYAVVRRNSGSTGAVSVSYRSVQVTATEGSDYTGKTGTLTWADGDSTPRVIEYPVLDDAAAEIPEIFDTDLSGATGGATTYPTDTFAHAAIEDNDSPVYADVSSGGGGGSAGTLSVAIVASTVQENGGAASVAITRTGGSIGAVTVEYVTSNGTAIAGSDYSVASGTLSWADGDAATKAVTVSVSNDSTIEGNETFALTLANVSGGASIGAASTTITIDDDDDVPAQPGSIAFASATASAAEAAGSAVLQVARTGGSTGAVSVSYSTSAGSASAGTDFTMATGILSWADGEVSAKTISVPVVNDTSQESSESFVVTLATPTGGAALGASSATVTINDDDSSNSSNDDKGGGGGGRFEWLMLLWLCGAGLARRRSSLLDMPRDE